MRVEIRLVSELEAGHNALVAVVPDPLDVVGDPALDDADVVRALACLRIDHVPLLDREKRLQIVLLEEVVKELRIHRLLAALRYAEHALFPPVVGAPLAQKPRAGLTERPRGVVGMVLEQPFAVAAFAHHARVTEDRRAGVVRQILDRRLRQIQRDREIRRIGG